MPNGYLAKRDQYQPDNIKLVIIAESPPVGDRYFYDPAGSSGEPLFAALMRRIGFSPTTKDKAEGLRRFQKKLDVGGCHLPTGEQVETC